MYRDGKSPVSERTANNCEHFIEILNYNTLLLRGKVMVKKYPESRYNTITKTPFSNPCFIIPKKNLSAVYIEHSRAFIKEGQFLDKL